MSGVQITKFGLDYITNRERSVGKYSIPLSGLPTYIDACRWGKLWLRLDGENILTLSLVMHGISIYEVDLEEGKSQNLYLPRNERLVVDIH